METATRRRDDDDDDDDDRKFLNSAGHRLATEWFSFFIHILRSATASSGISQHYSQPTRSFLISCLLLFLFLTRSGAARGLLLLLLLRLMPRLWPRFPPASGTRRPQPGVLQVSRCLGPGYPVPPTTTTQTHGYHQNTGLGPLSAGLRRFPWGVAVAGVRMAVVRMAGATPEGWAWDPPHGSRCRCVVWMRMCGFSFVWASLGCALNVL